MAQDIEQRGITVDVYTKNSGEVQDNDPLSVVRMWARLKPEMYAITAVLTDRVVNRALSSTLPCTTDELRNILDRRDPLGMSQPFRSLKQYSEKELVNALKDEFRDIEKAAFICQEPQDPIGSTLKRYKTLAEFHNRYLNPQGTTERSFINRGIGTATNTMAGILKVIPLVWARERSDESPNVSELTTIASSAYPVIAKLAMLHIRFFTQIDKQLRQNNIDHNDDFNEEDLFDSSNFLFQRGSNGLTLAFKDNLFEKTDDYVGEEPTIGCPAMVNLGERNAIKKLWDWHLSMAPTIYEYYLSRPNDGVDLTKNFEQYEEGLDVEAKQEMWVKMLQEVED